MNRSPIRWAALACAAAALAFSSAGAFAQSITLNDPNCSDFTLGGTAGNRTLTCVVSSPPVCTVTGPTTGTLNSAITMTASCSPAATSWVWSSDVGSGCNTAITQSCQDTQTAAGTVNYKVQGSNGQGQGPLSAAYPVAWSNTVLKPGSCSISGAPTGSQTAGVQVTLTVNCASGGQATSWSWTGTGAAGQTTQSVGPFAVNGTTTFTATATNSAGSTTTPGVTVTIGTGGGGGNITCTAAQGITGATHVINIAWGSTSQTFTSQNGGFGPNDALVLVFTAPANGGTLLKKASLSAAEYGDAPNQRYGTLSTQPCDFPPTLQSPTSAVPIIGGGPPPTEIFCSPNLACSTSVNLGWAFNPARTGAAQVQPGVKYYINIANQPGSCFANGSCNMILNWGWPSS